MSAMPTDVLQGLHGTINELQDRAARAEAERDQLAEALRDIDYRLTTVMGNNTPPGEAAASAIARAALSRLSQPTELRH